MPDLFNRLTLDEKRQRLERHGWVRAEPLPTDTGPMWRHPTLPCVLAEADAFAWLERYAAVEQWEDEE